MLLQKKSKLGSDKSKFKKNYARLREKRKFLRKKVG